MINLSPFSFLSSIAETESTDINNPLNKTKIFLQKQIPVSLLNLYRAYTYNLSVGCHQKPLSIVRKLITTTQKILNNRKKILFYPDFPYRKATFYQICLFLGYDVTNNPEEKFDLAIKWQRYKTFFSEELILSRLSKQNLDVINFHCKDVSKSLTNQLFDEAFGYSITVNPLTYTGKCVVKSNLNAQHDGRIISCPTDKTESGVVYQKLVDNEIEEDKVLDYRVPIFQQKIPCVYIYIKKNQTETQRFFGYPSLISVRVVEAKEIFNEDEISKILSVCQKLGLDYGELDVLRDKTDRRIYIVDANNTPSSRLLFEPLVFPPEKCILEPQDRVFALQKMAEAFKQEFFNIEK
ncbi:conserved hypothetical protein [Hyella patelloides LEGE 07179]|uniref:ATP-grasp domain-containing protein n=1 Tax=Hyella patelloides LEGE 07179 TaxID=945734 RepID=A0A563VKK1_9CYAN|nr:hypothetical protein [Hyella patelloides]VEP11941.1 conserved hypothetical protein [Hyella patelloides LEGE 07179]